MREWVKAIPLGVVVPVILWGTATPPELVASNISKWIELAGVTAPRWLSATSADHWVVVGTVLLAIIYSLIVWRVFVARTVGKIFHHLRLQAEAPASASLSMVVARASDRRIPLIELRALAIKRGWPPDLDPKTASSSWLNFTDALRQAALDGDVAFWGRESRSDVRAVILSEPLKMIGTDHWLKYKLDAISFLAAGDNMRIESRATDAPHWASIDFFGDFHVDREQATHWLENLEVPAI